MDQPFPHAAEEPDTRGNATSDALPNAPGFLKQWAQKSAAVDDAGSLLPVFRGEHGAVENDSTLHHRVGSITFSSVEAANIYAEKPNDIANDRGENPRVIAAYLNIEAPVMSNPDDPFLEFEDIISALGLDQACQLALEQHEWVEGTNQWAEDFSGEYESARDLVERSPERLQELYLQAWPVFDEARYVQWFSDAGYDGVIHGGSGATNGEPEYKVFSAEQVYSPLAQALFEAPSSQKIGPHIHDAQESLPKHYELPADDIARTTQAGNLLKQVAEGLYDDLEDQALSTGWKQEGSLMFARALQEWSGNQVSLGLLHQGDYWHAFGVAKYGEEPEAPWVVLDADGVTSLDRTLEKLNVTQGKENQWEIAIGDDAEHLASDIAESADHTRIAEGMAVALPSFNDWSKKLQSDITQATLDTSKPPISHTEMPHELEVGEPCGPSI